MREKIEVNGCKRTSGKKKYSVLFTVDNSSINLLNKHSSLAPLFTPEFQSKGGIKVYESKL